MRGDETREARRDEAAAESFGHADAKLPRQVRRSLAGVDARRRRRHRLGMRDECPARRGQDEAGRRAFEQGLLQIGLEAAHPPADRCRVDVQGLRSEEHTSELQSIMRTSYAVFCLKKKKQK